jgi:hypothetical protein
MHAWLARGFLAAFACAALMSAVAGYAEVPSPPPPSAATPTNAEPSEAPPSDYDYQWLSIGAVAECRDGKFFHGRPDPRACVEHGGVRRWMRGPEQDLIR